MSGGFQSSTVGTLLRSLTGGKVEALKYADECQNVDELLVQYDKGDKPVLLTWHEDDPERPYNWPRAYKVFVASIVMFQTLAAYASASAYTSAIEGPDSIQADFGVSHTIAVLGLSLFVIGYGIAPMLFHPLADLPAVGRLPVYIATHFAFIACQIAAAKAPSMPALLGLRFATGFFISPTLATGAASMGDMWTPGPLAYALAFWAFGAVAGPAVGPIMGGYVFQERGWRWVMLAILYLNVGVTSIALFMPETSSATLLYRRSKRIAHRTGVPVTTEEVEVLHKRGMHGILVEALWGPIRMIPEPILLVYNLFISLVYGVFYLFFESFPIVFGEIRGFTVGETGLTFLGITICVAIFLLYYCWWSHREMAPVLAANGGFNPDPERRLTLTPYCAALASISIFCFGWTGQLRSAHWFFPVIFSGLYCCGEIGVFQTIFAYFGDVYFESGAIGAVFTLNDLFRSSFAGAFPLFAHAMYKHLGIGPACSLLGGISALFVPMPIISLRYGKQIRRRSKWASKTGL